MLKPGKRSNKLPPFVPLTWELLNSKAYKSLTPSAGKALPYFIGKVKVKAPYKDPLWCSTIFELSYSEAEKLGFAGGTYSRVISKLIEKGFIDPVDKGGLRGCGRSYNQFKLSERWKNYGTQEFEDKNWKSFQPRMK